MVMTAGAVRVVVSRPAAGNAWRALVLWSRCRSRSGIDFFAAILFLYMGGQNFWQVVAVGGDGTEAQAQAEIANIKGIINGLEFL